MKPIEIRWLNRLEALLHIGLGLIGSQSVLRLNRTASLEHNLYCMGHSSPYRVLGWVSSVRILFPKGTDDVLNRLENRLEWRVAGWLRRGQIYRIIRFRSNR
jgi:hypothetical protein